MKHPDRILAEKRVERASKACREFNGTDPKEWDKLDSELSVAAKELVELEQRFPLKHELEKKRRILFLRSRGIDV